MSKNKDEFISYKVGNNETFSSIAKKLKIKEIDLRNLNESPEGEPYEGQIIKAMVNDSEPPIIFLIVLFCFLFLAAVTGATLSIYNYYSRTSNLNIDLDNDGICDINCDIDNDNKADYNIDTNGDNIPEINISKPNEKTPIWNIDTNNDGKADSNLINQDKNNDGKCDLNCNVDKNNRPTTDIDINGDGVCDTNCSDQIPVVPSETYTINYLDTELSSNLLVPGWTGKKTFKLINNNSIPIKYSIKWIKVKNTYTPTNNLYFGLTRNKEVLKDITSSRVPNTDGYLIENLTLPANTTYEHELDFLFKQTNINQDMDKSKVFEALLQIEIGA